MQRFVTTYHPAEPQAGLAGGAKGDIGGGDVRRGLQGLDLPGRLTGRTGAHDVHLMHPEPGAKETSGWWINHHKGGCLVKICCW